MSAAVVIRGTVHRDAHHTRGRDGTSYLSFDVAAPSPPHARPVLLRVLLAYGTGEAAAYAAGTRAKRLRRGVRVVVHGAGIERGRPLRVQQVATIEEPDLVVRPVTGDGGV